MSTAQVSDRDLSAVHSYVETVHGIDCLRGASDSLEAVMVRIVSDALIAGGGAHAPREAVEAFSALLPASWKRWGSAERWLAEE